MTQALKRLKATAAAPKRGKPKNYTMDGPTDYEAVDYDTKALFKDVEEACDKLDEVDNLMLQVDMERWAKDKGAKQVAQLKKLEQAFKDAKKIMDAIYNDIQD